MPAHHLSLTFMGMKQLPYARHHRPLLIKAALEYKPYIRPKVTVHNWSFEMGLNNIQAAAYNGARTVLTHLFLSTYVVCQCSLIRNGGIK